MKNDKNKNDLKAVHNTTGNNLRGRPTKYKTEYDREAYNLTLLGYTDKQLAEHFEINQDTVYEWRVKHPSFAESIKKGKDLIDAQVVGALLKRALGFKYDEVTFEKLDGKTVIETTTTGQLKEGEAYKKKVVTKLVVPDVGAQMNWLKNRQKELWRDNDIDFSKFTEEQLNYIIEGLKKKSAQ